MGQPELADSPDYAKLADRSKNRVDLDRLIERWTMTKTRHELMDLLKANDVICGVVKELHEVMTEPHLFERGALREIDHPQLGRMTVITSPIRLNGEPSVLESPSPVLGADNEKVYGEQMGFSVEDLAALRERKVI